MMISEQKIFRKRPTSKKNYLWPPLLLRDPDEMSNLYKGTSIDTSFQDLVQLTKRFQRRRLKCENLTDDRRRSPKAHIAFGKVT